jgi:hypothetical protein
MGDAPMFEAQRGAASNLPSIADTDRSSRADRVNGSCPSGRPTRSGQRRCGELADGVLDDVWRRRRRRPRAFGHRSARPDVRQPAPGSGPRPSRRSPGWSKATKTWVLVAVALAFAGWHAYGVTVAPERPFFWIGVVCDVLVAVVAWLLGRSWPAEARFGPDAIVFDLFLFARSVAAADLRNRSACVPGLDLPSTQPGRMPTTGPERRPACHQTGQRSWTQHQLGRLAR